MNITDAYFDPTGSYLWAIGCDPVPEAPSNYSTHILTLCAAPPNNSGPALTFQGTGNYTDLTGPGATSYLVCQIAPKTTVIQAEYAGDNINLRVESVSSPTQDAGGPAGFFAMYIITDLVWHQQAVTVNGVADQLLQLSVSVDADQYVKIVVSALSDLKRWNSTRYPQEQYLQGVVEYSASVCS